MSFTWDKPILFRRAQSTAARQPQVVGHYFTREGFRRTVVVLRSWDNAPSFAIYNDGGKLIKTSPDDHAANSTGIFDFEVFNGCVVGEVTQSGVGVNITYEGDVPIKVELP